MGQRQRPYIVFEDKNLDFTPKEVAIFEKLLEKDFNIPDIAKYLKRSQLEILLLYLDRVDRNFIEPIHKIIQIDN